MTPGKKTRIQTGHYSGPHEFKTIKETRIKDRMNIHTSMVKAAAVAMNEVFSILKRGTAVTKGQKLGL